MDKSVAGNQILVASFRYLGIGFALLSPPVVSLTCTSCSLFGCFSLVASFLPFALLYFLVALLPFFTFAVSRLTFLKPRTHHGITGCITPVEKSYIG
jgi:hypothetical protein